MDRIVVMAGQVPLQGVQEPAVPLATGGAGDVEVQEASGVRRPGTGRGGGQDRHIEAQVLCERVGQLRGVPLGATAPRVTLQYHQSDTHGVHRTL